MRVRTIGDHGGPIFNDNGRIDLAGFVVPLPDMGSLAAGFAATAVKARRRWCRRCR